MDYATLAKSFGAFFAIMNPFVNLPIVLSLTANFTVPEQRSLTLRIALYSAAMCGLILIAGHQIIAFFGVNIDHFRIAGGLVLAHIAWSLLNGSEIASHHGTEADIKDASALNSLAFYPITFPMIVGPGTIATIIIYATHVTSPEGLVGLAAVIALVLSMLTVVLYFSASFGKLMTQTMHVIMTRLMGMILLAIAVEMILVGVKAVLG